MWEKTVKGMLEEANVKVELVITQYAFHAKEYVTNHKALLSSFDAILPIGGDGILAEVINGIVQRPDGQDLLQNLPIIPIPGGTSNGISRSLLFQICEGPSELNAIYNVVKGKPSPMDLSKVLTLDGKSHYAFLMLSWGLIADIDIKSEVLRCLGEVRLHLFAVYFMMRKHLYRGRLKMKLIPKPTYTDPEFLSKISVNKVLPGDVVEDAAIEREESGVSEDGAKWVTIEGDFVMLTILQASHLSTSVHFGPGVRLDDGAFTVYLAMGNASRLQMLGLLLSSDGGGHVYSPAIRIFQCTEYILEPLTTAGLYSLDGEVVQYGRIEGKVMPSAARILLNTP
jgi:sphingosine kinase